MQYTQRKLQRSVTEMRRSCSDRPRASAAGPGTSSAPMACSTALANRWISERWEPVAVESSCVQERIVTPMRYDDIAQWRFDGFMIDLHRTEAEGYHLNLVAPEPAVFVMWRMLEPEALVPDGPLA